MLGPKKELWDLLQKVEKVSKSSEAGDITASVRDLPTVKTALGRARVWLRLALMQKKLSDYFRLLVGQKEMLAEFYEPSSLMRSDEANLISALLTSLNVVDCNLCVKVGPPGYPAFSLVDLLQYCALIGRELQSVEIFSCTERSYYSRS